MTTIDSIAPKGKARIIDLLASLGVDVSSWGAYKGGELRAAANPKYCYEWSFDEAPKFIVTNFWIHQLSEVSRRVVWHRDLKYFTQTGLPVQRERGRRLEAALERAFDERLPVRVILCDGDRRREGGRTMLKARGLDPEAWAVTSYDKTSGLCEVVRGALPVANESASGEDDEARVLGFDGQRGRRWFVNHRRREASFRKAKIREALESAGRLLCEVPGCGFDFAVTYGGLGDGFAHVHHKTPLNAAPPEGIRVLLSDLSIVCANCHSMIHRGGECRRLEEVSPVLGRNGTT